tara:strand:- start:132 stop:575 length:444 start_codon:yes stop_codon:yes gene_type:complete
MSLIRNLTCGPLQIASNLAGAYCAGDALATKGSYLKRVASGLESITHNPIETLKGSYQATLDVYNVLNGIIQNRGILDVIRDASPNLQRVTESLKGVLDSPIEAGAAAATLLGLGYGLSRGIRFIRTKGQGTIVTKCERNLGKIVFK